jgi:hypothetical protein
MNGAKPVNRSIFRPGEPWPAAGKRIKPTAWDIKAFSSEADTGSREESASKQKIRASVLLQNRF